MFSLNWMLYPIKLLISAPSFAEHRFECEKSTEPQKTLGEVLSLGRDGGFDALSATVPPAALERVLHHYGHPLHELVCVQDYYQKEIRMASLGVVSSAPKTVAFCRYSPQKETAALSAAVSKALLSV